MGKKSKNVKIISSPFDADFEIVDKMAMVLSAPYSDKDVTIRSNPNIQEYKEKLDKPGIKTRGFRISTSTNQTVSLTFDFKKNNEQKIKIEGTEYTIKLLEIGKTNKDGQDFPYFEFHVTW